MAATPPRVLVTRSPRQASALAERLRERGAEPVLVPTIEIVEPSSFAVLDDAVASLGSFHWVIFTSANAVEVFARRVSRRAENSAALPRVAAIGPSTARALEQIGIVAELVPAVAVAESLAAALLPYSRQPEGSSTRFLLVRAEEARGHLPETLRAAGAVVTIAPAYRTIVPEGAEEQIRNLYTTRTLDAITFTSSSTARNLFALLEASRITLPPSVVRASIGPITSATLRDLGFPPHVEADEATVASLAEMLVKYLRARPKT